MKAIINTTLLAQLKPKDKPYDVRDTKLTGFLVRVNISGKLLYMCEYARGKRITIGKIDVLTPVQARDEAKRILGQAAMGISPNSKRKLPVNEPVSFEKFLIHEYESWRKASRKSAQDDLQRLKVNFLEEFGECLLGDISPVAVEKWRTKRINQGIKVATVNRDIVILRSALAKAVEWGFIPEHPLLKLKPFKTDSIAKIRYLTKEEEASLKIALVARDKRMKQARLRGNEWRNDRDYDSLPNLNEFVFADYLSPMVLVTLNTGLRRAELLNLKWENINFERAILTVRGDTAKSGRTRYIPLNAVALKALKDWKKSNSSEGLIFSNKKTGEAFGHVKRSWGNIKKAAKIKSFRWHDMRHHFASKLVMAGADLNSVRELLGHSDIKMTLRYAHLAPEHKAKVVAMLVEA